MAASRPPKQNLAVGLEITLIETQTGCDGFLNETLKDNDAPLA